MIPVPTRAPILPACIDKVPPCMHDLSFTLALLEPGDGRAFVARSARR